MKAKKLLTTVVCVLGLSGCVGVSPDGKGYTVTVPMNVINSTVGENFPQSQKTSYGTLLIDKPNILGKQGSDKLGVGTSFRFSNMLMPSGIKGRIALSSGLRYNPQDRGLYLASPMVDEIAFQDFALSKYITPQMRQLIGDLVAQKLLSKPIYRMNNISSFVKGVGVHNGNVQVTVGL